MENETESANTPKPDSKKKLMIGAAVAIILLLGLYVYSQRAEAPTEVGTPVETADTGAAPRSLRDLIGLGTSQKCTFTNSIPGGGTSQGTMYIAGGKMRGDFTTTESGRVVASHMIADDKEMRMWQDGESMGFLMQVPTEEADASGAPTGPNQSPINYDDPNVDYQCSGWTVDNSLFVPPSNVEFHSMADMMKMNMGASAETQTSTEGSDAGMGIDMEASMSAEAMKALQCQACDQAPDAASRAQCRTALQCS